MSHPEVTCRRWSFPSVNGIGVALILGAIVIVHASVVQPKLVHAARLRGEIASLKNELSRTHKTGASSSSDGSRVEVSLVRVGSLGAQPCSAKRQAGSNCTTASNQVSGNDELAVFQLLSRVAGNGLIEFDAVDRNGADVHSRPRFRTLIHGTMPQMIEWLSKLETPVGTILVERVIIHPKEGATTGGPAGSADSRIAAEVWFRTEVASCGAK